LPSTEKKLSKVQAAIKKREDARKKPAKKS